MSVMKRNSKVTVPGWAVFVLVVLLMCGLAGASVEVHDEAGEYYPTMSAGEIVSTNSLVKIGDAGEVVFPALADARGVDITVDSDEIVVLVDAGRDSRAMLLGLNIFRSRTGGKKRIKPSNDSDPWQIIFKEAKMICYAG